MMSIVKNYMMRTLNSVCSDDTIGYVIELMHKSEMTVLPVVDNENIFLGTLYSRNILKNIIAEDYGFIETHRLLYRVNLAAETMAEMKDKKVEEFMSKNTTCVRETDEMDNVANMMLSNNEQYLFVTNDNNKLRGYISRADLLFYLLKVAKKR